MPSLSLQIIVETDDFKPESIVELAKEENLDLDLFIINPKEKTIEGFQSNEGPWISGHSSGSFIEDIQSALSAARGDYFAIVRSSRMCSMDTITRMLKEAEKGFDVVVASRFSGKKRKFDLKTTVIKLLVREMNGISDPLSLFFIAKKSLLAGINLSTSPETLLPELIIKNRTIKISEIYQESGTKGKIYSGSFISYTYSLLRLSKYRAIKFGLVGLSGIGINEGAEYIFHAPFGLIIPFALLISIELSIIWNFTFNNAWTFSDRKFEPVAIRFLKFNSVTALGAVVNYVFGNVLSPFIYFLYANLIGILAGFAINYLGSDYLVWKTKRD